jgi:hypothetical protein
MPRSFAAARKLLRAAIAAAVVVAFEHAPIAWLNQHFQGLHQLVSR